MENTSHIEGDEETPSLNPSDIERDETVNPPAEMEPELSNGSFLQTINRINFQKWHSKVRIVIAKDFEFEVVALVYIYIYICRDTGPKLYIESWA